MLSTQHLGGMGDVLKCSLLGIGRVMLLDRQLLGSAPFEGMLSCGLLV